MDDIERLVRDKEQLLRKERRSAGKQLKDKGGQRETNPGLRVVNRESGKIFQRIALLVIATQSLYVFGFTYAWVLLIPLALYVVVRLATAQSRRKVLISRLKPIEKVVVGTYIGGLDGVNRSLQGIECVIGEADFIFLLRSGNELVRIPRDAVNHISVEDGNRAPERTSLGQRMARGMRSLVVPDAPRKDGSNAHCLLIDWLTGQSTRQTALFEFSGPSATEDVHAALTVLYRYLKQKPGRSN